MRQTRRKEKGLFHSKPIVQWAIYNLSVSSRRVTTFWLILLLSVLSGLSFNKYSFDTLHDVDGDHGQNGAYETFVDVEFPTSTLKLSLEADVVDNTAIETLRPDTTFRNINLRPPRNIFDCDEDVLDPACVYFDPLTYFAPSGSPLPRDLLQRATQYWGNNMNNTATGILDLFIYSILNDVGVYNALEWSGVRHAQPEGWPHTIVGLHIHKCGGSSVSRTFLKVANSGNPRTNQYNLTLFYKNDLRARFRLEKGISWVQQSVEYHKRLLRKIKMNQMHFDAVSSPPADHVAFTFVREPVGRFLSAVREFLVSRNKRKRLCLEATNGTELLRCIVSTLRQNEGLKLDQHFAPATVSFYMFSILEPSVKISVFPLSDESMANFQSTLLGSQSRVMKIKSSKPRKYAITMDELREAGLVPDVCELYWMDVLLMQHLGIPSTLCEKPTGI